MPKPTQHDRLVAALEAQGAKVVSRPVRYQIPGPRPRYATRPSEPGFTGKYTVLLDPNGQLYWFVGPSGALRKGRTISGSQAVRESIRAQLLATPS